MISLDWSKAHPGRYEDSKDGVKNDGNYTYTLPTMTRMANTILEVTCRLIVGPKQSETAGSGKNQKRHGLRIPLGQHRQECQEGQGDHHRLEGQGYQEEEAPGAGHSSVIDGMPVTAIEDERVPGQEAVTSITVPAGVTAIGTGAFADCAKLTTLTLPDSLTSIGMNLTDNSNKLENMKLSVGLETTMDKDASGCYTIKHVDDKKTDPDNPVMSQTVTLPEGFPTDIAVAKPGKLTLEADFVVKAGHEVAEVSRITQDEGLLKAEIIWVDDDRHGDRQDRGRLWGNAPSTMRPQEGKCRGRHDLYLQGLDACAGRCDRPGDLQGGI